MMMQRKDYGKTNCSVCEQEFQKPTELARTCSRFPCQQEASRRASAARRAKRKLLNRKDDAV